MVRAIGLCGWGCCCCQRWCFCWETFGPGLCGFEGALVRLCGGFCMVIMLALGSGLPISKLAWELVLGLRALIAPILKLERPTPGLARYPWGISFRLVAHACETCDGYASNLSPFRIGV